DRTFPPPPAPPPDGRGARDQKCRQKEQSSCAYRLRLFLKAACLETRFTLSALFFSLRRETAFLAGARCSCSYVPERISATLLPRAYFNSAMPLPVTAEISNNSSLRFLQCLRRAATFSGLATSILAATTTIGFFSRPAPKLFSSSMMTLKSATG